ncbi:Argininosuccinate lyase [Actinidia chinensis var. chinensis]|uniref:Argininosuccinate lyase n=1 Tax=Actinidia chinensis var. chinensis TaxID=1590841 RepID=A0A2R6RMT7_ACTCC|nr:Argininosuccinate lyase [Actinidia chinensis var. chinensis]
MKDEESQKTTITTSNWKKEGSNSGGLMLGKGRYKLWALAAILLLAFWSMFTGTVTLKWSAGNLSDRFHSPILHDLDILELEEREKFVRQMWNAYTHSNKIRLPSFWTEAFEAAYEDLTSDIPGVRNAAVSEIAGMSLRTISVQSPTAQSKSTRGERNISKQSEEDKKVVSTNQ